MIYEMEVVDNKYVVRYNEDILKGKDKSKLIFVIMDMVTNYKILLIMEMNRNKKAKDSSLYFFK